MVSYVGFTVAYVGVIVAYVGLVIAYVAGVVAYVGLVVAYHGLVVAYVGLVAAYAAGVAAYVGLVVAYVGLVVAYVGLVVAYVGLVVAYVGLGVACVGLVVAYDGSLQAYDGSLQAYDGVTDPYDSATGPYDGVRDPHQTSLDRAEMTGDGIAFTAGPLPVYVAAVRRAWRSFAWTLIPLAAVVAMVLWQARAAGDFQIDDAYITFSYSKNLALGHGPVYSHGVRVEGYSNFLWMLLVAGPLAIRPTLDPYLVARLLTLPFAALLGWAVYALVRLPDRDGRRSPPSFAWAALLLLACNVDLTIAALSALETLPYVALLTAGFALHLRGLGGDARARRLTLPCFTALALTRIDGFLPLAYLLAAELGSRILDRSVRPRDFLRWAAPGVAVFLLWFAWRWRYYGLPLPTTVYAKELIPRALPDRGLAYAKDFGTSTGLWITGPFALIALLGRRRRQAAELAVFVLAHTAYVVRVGGDWMPFWRFFLPVVPAAVVLVTWGLDEAVERAARFRLLAGTVVAAAGFGVLAFVGARVDGHVGDTQPEKDKLRDAGYVAGGMKGNLLPAARLMGHVVRPGQRLVSDYAGVMAYFTEASVLDMWGLANADIALHGTTEGVNPIWGKTCPPCYARMDPDYFHVPGVSAPDAFRSHSAVAGALWQSNTIGKHVDFRQFAAGRVVDRGARRAMWFLERRRAGSVFAAREPAPGIVVEYPFEGVERR